MMTFKLGSLEMYPKLPYIEIELETGRWLFEWWYEISYWEVSDEHPNGIWCHDIDKDGGAFGLWNAMRKAESAADVCYIEQIAKLHENGKESGKTE